MSTAELEAYAQTGALPGWFQATVGATLQRCGMARVSLGLEA
jgi:hypothetical protein